MHGCSITTSVVVDRRWCCFYEVVILLAWALFSRQLSSTTLHLSLKRRREPWRQHPGFYALFLPSLARIRSGYSSGTQRIAGRYVYNDSLKSTLLLRLRQTSTKRRKVAENSSTRHRLGLRSRLATNGTNFEAMSTSSIDRLDDETHPGPNLTLRHRHHDHARPAIDLRPRLFSICGKRELEILQQSHDDDKHFQDAYLGSS